MKRKSMAVLEFLHPAPGQAIQFMGEQPLARLDMSAI